MDSMDFCRGVAKRIRQVRELRGLTQIEVSKLSGLNRASIARIENGSGSITLDTIFKIAHSLDVEVIELLKTDLVNDNFIINLGESLRLSKMT